MKKIDLYSLTLFITNIYLVFRFAPLIQSGIATRTLTGKQTFFIILAAFAGLSVFLIFRNLYQVISSLETNDEAAQKKIIIAAAKNTITAITLFFILSLLQSFVVYQ